MSKKRMLADVLWDAANNRLWAGASVNGRGAMYSCHAAFDAVCGSSYWDERVRPVRRFLESLGCDAGVGGFDDYPQGVKSQGVRYLWLLLAMHVAEDEGITV